LYKYKNLKIENKMLKIMISVIKFSYLDLETDATSGGVANQYLIKYFTFNEIQLIGFSIIRRKYWSRKYL